jgi:hypothetical protein
LPAAFRIVFVMLHRARRMLRQRLGDELEAALKDVTYFRSRSHGWIGAKIAKPEFMDAACAGQPPLTVINPRNMTERGGGEQGRDAAESPRGRRLRNSDPKER